MISIFLFFKNGDFKELEEVGYRNWIVSNVEIEKQENSVEIFTKEKGYLYQVEYNVKDPYVEIYYLNECFGAKFKVSLLDESENLKRSSSVVSIKIEKNGNYDSVKFSISLYNSASENCKLKIYKIESNFLKNISFSEKEYKPKYWNFDKNKFWQSFEFKPGTIYKIKIKSNGKYRFYIDCIDYREKTLKLMDYSEILDTISAYCFKQHFVFILDSGNINEVIGETLGILNFVVSSKSKKIFIYKNIEYNGKILIYDKNGKLVKSEVFDENPKVFEFEKRGKYLVVIPRKLRKEVRI
ncbi:MAG: hypothetical protein N2504_01105 [candidate division WOR-3 bacterium]|nr:hypothetical protein [candidate division WOR-3 bacterium]MCX7947173.1 hypothetical protein [candidate division WOR-3 bacterium]MDW8150229.1 hypothetical protein [candidate division WOR-3 bacterium]